MLALNFFIEFLFLSFVGSSFCFDQLTGGDHCFCKLKGQIGDCSCSVDTVDYFNNVKIFPRLKSLLDKDYFRFYKVNLKKECPFWSDDSRCAMRFCHVKPCREDEIPPGLKGEQSRNHHDHEDMHIKYLEASQNTEDCDAEVDDELGYLNTTISESAYEEFALWQAHDDAQDNFCTLPDEDGEAQYVDLSLNVERYTGYRGPSAHRIWRSIYMENCFSEDELKILTENNGEQKNNEQPKNSFDAYIPSSKLNGLCLEKRVFYRVISGLHSSINIHLSSQYLFPDTMGFGGIGESIGFDGVRGEGGRWAPNLQEFKQRFDPEYTKGEGPSWLRNLYFLYLLELRAVAKAAPYLGQLEYYTGRDAEDQETSRAIKHFLQVVKSFPGHFNESTMFNGGAQSVKLKEDFKQHFRNISRIMDCVGCEKCKLWGKLQIQGLGTALKILFSGRFDQLHLEEIGLNTVLSNGNGKKFTLERSEVVALFNALGRLSTSIYEIENFRKMMR